MNSLSLDPFLARILISSLLLSFQNYSSLKDENEILRRDLEDPTSISCQICMLLGILCSNNDSIFYFPPSYYSSSSRSPNSSSSTIEEPYSPPYKKQRKRKWSFDSPSSPSHDFHNVDLKNEGGDEIRNQIDQAHSSLFHPLGDYFTFLSIFKKVYFNNQDWRDRRREDHGRGDDRRRNHQEFGSFSSQGQSDFISDHFLNFKCLRNSFKIYDQLIQESSKLLTKLERKGDYHQRDNNSEYRDFGMDSSSLLIFNEISSSYDQTIKSFSSSIKKKSKKKKSKKRSSRDIRNDDDDDNSQKNQREYEEMLISLCLMDGLFTNVAVQSNSMKRSSETIILKSLPTFLQFFTSSSSSSSNTTTSEEKKDEEKKDEEESSGGKISLSIFHVDNSPNFYSCSTTSIFAQSSSSSMAHISQYVLYQVFKSC